MARAAVATLVLARATVARGALLYPPGRTHGSLRRGIRLVLGPGFILLVARSDLRHAIGVLSLRHLGGGAGTEREAECSKSGSTPRVGRLPLTDEGIHWVHADG